jgi:hypothetical protein
MRKKRSKRKKVGRRWPRQPYCAGALAAVGRRWPGRWPLAGALAALGQRLGGGLTQCSLIQEADCPAAPRRLDTRKQIYLPPAPFVPLRPMPMPRVDPARCASALRAAASTQGRPTGRHQATGVA